MHAVTRRDDTEREMLIMISDKSGFGTKAIHGGHGTDDPHGALNVPIYQNATFRFKNTQQGADRFAGVEKGYIYSRTGNPTVASLESRVALLENAEAAISFSSGMAAISSAILTICKSGDHIVADKTLYGCTYTLFDHALAKYNVSTTFVNFADLDALGAAIQDNTAIVYMETPANPNMKILDIEAIAQLAHGKKSDIAVICDNTFATPFITRPLDLGCDLVVHSATKYINGHGDVISGFACGSEELIKEIRMLALKDLNGGALGPFEAFLILRGLKTMEVRMIRHCDNAEKLVDYLANHPKVEKVHYPGLPSHPNHEVAKKQMARFGGMVAFEVKGGRSAGAALLDNMKLCTIAVSLGDAETLVEHPASMTHGSYSAEELIEAEIPEGLVRLSVGLENPEDIIADFEQAFAMV